MFDLFNHLGEYDYVFVDVDNTLYNYKIAHEKALNQTANVFNFNITDYNKAKKDIKKRGLKANQHKKELYFKKLCENKNIHFSVSLEMYNFYFKIFLENILVDASMFNYIKACKATGKKVVAITNYYVLPQIKKLNASKFSRFIDFMITSEEFEEEKPHVKLLNYAKKVSGCTDNSKIVMIGDSIADDFGFQNIRSYPYNCSKLLISVSGKSGAGKTTLSNTIHEVFEGSLAIEGDGYHKYDRNHPEWKNITHYNPEGNNLVQLSLDIQRIYQDIGDIDVPIYNHDNGLFEAPQNIKHSELDVVVIDGLHSLYEEVTGEFVKIKIFLDNEFADAQKIARDVIHRNKTEDEVLNSILKRENDYDAFIKKQKYFANFIIEIHENDFKFIISKDIDLYDFEHDIAFINWTEDSFIITGEKEFYTLVFKDILEHLKSKRWLGGNNEFSGS